MVFGKKKGGLWSLLTRGLYSEGKYREISLGGILSGLCREGGTCSGVVSRSGLTVVTVSEVTDTWHKYTSDSTLSVQHLFYTIE